MCNAALVITVIIACAGGREGGPSFHVRSEAVDVVHVQETQQQEEGCTAERGWP